MSNLNEILKFITPEQIHKAGACKNAEELLTFAKAEGIDLTAEQAEKVLKMLNPPYGELTEDEMDAVAGGTEKPQPDPDCRTNICRKCGYHFATYEPIGTKIRCVGCGSTIEVYR